MRWDEFLMRQYELKIQPMTLLIDHAPLFRILFLGEATDAPWYERGPEGIDLVARRHRQPMNHLPSIIRRIRFIIHQSSSYFIRVIKADAR